MFLINACPASVSTLSRIASCPVRTFVTSSAGSKMPLSDIPDVDIDPNGKFKYILVKDGAYTDLVGLSPQYTRFTADDHCGILPQLVPMVTPVCTDTSSNDAKNIVRGYAKCNYHSDIFDVSREAAGLRFKLDCLGGGKIKHQDDAKSIVVYGESQGYGPADHSVTVNILKKKYPDYKITSSTEDVD